MPLNLPHIISAETLHDLIGEPDLLVVDVSSEADFLHAHIKSAVQVDYAAYVTAHPPVMGLIPDAGQLSLVLSSIGMTEDKHIVAYDREGGGKAGRLLYTLDALGIHNTSLLDGGLQAWVAAGYGAETVPHEVAHTSFKADMVGENAVDKDYIQSRLGDDNVVFLDCRTPAEYSGLDVRAAKGGHIPGAVNFNWTDAIDPDNAPKLLPENVLRQMFEQIGVTPEKEVIAYCQTHHRSSHTYQVLKQLGFQNVKGYPGAWSDWGNDPDTPVEA